MNRALYLANKRLSRVKEFIGATELAKLVTEDMGSTLAGVRGSLYTSGGPTMLKSDSFKKDWVYCKKGSHGRVVRKILHSIKKHGKVYKVEYDGIGKIKCRHRCLIMPLIDYCGYMKIDDPSVFTLAANKGLCVKAIQSVFPDAEITNLERDISTLDEYQKLKLGTTDIHADLKKFVEEDDLVFDLLNLDLTGFMSSDKIKLFTAINDKTSAEVISLTMQYSKKLRGDQKSYVTEIYKRFEGVDDVVKAWTEDLFNNFKLVDSHVYKRDPNQVCVLMRTFVFERI